MRAPQMLDERLLCASSAGVSSWPRIWLDLRAGRSRRDAGAAEAFSSPLRRGPRRRGGRCGGSGWFSRLGALLFGSVAADFEKRQVALKAGSRALPVAALRPRPKYVLFDCYAGAHSCLAAMEHRCATRRSALRGTLVCLGTLGLLVCLDTLGLLVCVDTLGRTTAFWPLARPPWLPRSNGEAFAGKPCPFWRPARSVSVHRGDGDAQCSVLSCRQKRPLRRLVFLCLARKVPRRRRRLQDALGGVRAVRGGLLWNSRGGPSPPATE